MVFRIEAEVCFCHLNVNISHLFLVRSPAMTPHCTRCEVQAQVTPAQDPPETPSPAAEAHPEIETGARRTSGDGEQMRRRTSSAGLQVQMWRSDSRWIVFLDHLLTYYPPCSRRSLQHKTNTTLQSLCCNMRHTCETELKTELKETTH